MHSYIRKTLVGIPSYNYDSLIELNFLTTCSLVKAVVWYWSVFACFLFIKTEINNVSILRFNKVLRKAISNLLTSSTVNYVMENFFKCVRLRMV